MLVPAIYRKTLWERRRGLVVWSISVALLVVSYVALYPSIKDQTDELTRMVRGYPDAVKGMFGLDDLGSPAGYLHTELFSFLLPLVLTVYAIGFATDTTAGEEERRTMDLLLSNPVSRRRVVVEKMGGVASGLVIIGSVVFLAIVAVAPLFGIHLAAARVAAATASEVLMGVAFGGVAMLVACLTGRRGIARGIAAAVAVMAFLVSSLGATVEWLKPVRKLSFLYYAVGTEPLKRGVGWSNLVMLLAAAVVLAAAAVAVFDRRDLAG